MLLLAVSALVQAQMHNPVKWKFEGKSTAAGEGELVITATIESGWHLYSQFIDAGGPVPTSFKFEKSSDFELVGKVKEITPVTKGFDKTFNMNIAYFSNKAVFVQKIKLKKPVITAKGSIEFMVCDDEQCLPPDEASFSIVLKDTHTKEEVPEATKPEEKTDTVAVQPVADTLQTNTDSLESKQDTTSVVSPTENNGGGASATGGSSLWAIFLGGLLGGFAAFFMPCIFPMVPFTVSYFTKSSEKGSGIGKVFIYALSIIVIYVGVGMLISALTPPDTLNDLATNGIFNFFFFALLIVFAASFLGAFEITLPSSWVNKMDAKGNSSGLLGIFFMAATLALVSFSCTGPIIGTLLVEAATKGQILGPTIGMLGFAIALAVPFTLFAMFPSWLKSMPKSGGWLNSVKVVLGFLELALALKFLSNVDLAYHWDWFDREVFLVLWIVIFGMLGFYLLGKLRFPHDSEVKSVSVFRLFLSIIVLSFTVYMIPGLWGAPLRSIAAFLPPQHTQDFDLHTRSLGTTASSSTSDALATRKYSDIFHAPLNLNAFFDYEEGMAYAKKVGKPVILDFTGHTCVNCRKMEADVWPNADVLSILNNDYVLIQLYVDDKTELPANEQYTSTFTGKKVKTIGNKWSDFQASNYHANSQPYYVLLDNEGKTLVAPQGANYNVGEYVAFLRSGLEKYKAK